MFLAMNITFDEYRSFRKVRFLNTTLFIYFLVRNNLLTLIYFAIWSEINLISLPLSKPSKLNLFEISNGKLYPSFYSKTYQGIDLQHKRRERILVYSSYSTNLKKLLNRFNVSQLVDKYFSFFLDPSYSLRQVYWFPLGEQNTRPYCE